MFALRFESKVDRSGDHALWLGTTSLDGYGLITVRKPVMMQAHRAAWELEHGPIPAGVLILHGCDTPPCVKVAHLFPGTHADNMRDMFAKGRRPVLAFRGSRHPHTHLTEDDVRTIRSLRGVETYRALAERYGVGTSTIYRLWDDHDPSWSHVK